MSVATGASSSPIKATMGPMAAGGKDYVEPFAASEADDERDNDKYETSGDKAAQGMLESNSGVLARVMQVMVGAIKAKLDPRKAGALPRQTKV